jgi:hypothetical protein
MLSYSGACRRQQTTPNSAETLARWFEVGGHPLIFADTGGFLTLHRLLVPHRDSLGLCHDAIRNPAYNPSFLLPISASGFGFGQNGREAHATEPRLHLLAACYHPLFHGDSRIAFP